MMWSHIAVVDWQTRFRFPASIVSSTNTVLDVHSIALDDES